MKRIQAVGFDLKWNQQDGEYNKLDFRELFPSQLFGNRRYIFLTEEGNANICHHKAFFRIPLIIYFHNNINDIRLSRGLGVVEKIPNYTIQRII